MTHPIDSNDGPSINTPYTTKYGKPSVPEPSRPAREEREPECECYSDGPIRIPTAGCPVHPLPAPTPIGEPELSVNEEAMYRAIARRLFRVEDEGVLSCSHPSGDSCIDRSEPIDNVCDACAVVGAANAIGNLLCFFRTPERSAGSDTLEPGEPVEGDV